MDPITGLMIGKGVGSIFSLLSGIGADRPQLPEYLERMLRNLAEMRNYEGFLPNKTAYDQSIRTQVDEILGTIPMASEQFEADISSRGIHGAGEAPAYKAAKVYAPVTRAAATAVAQGELGYAEAFQRGNIAAEQLRAQAVERLMRYKLAEYGYQYQDYMMDMTGRAGFFGDIGDVLGYLGAEDIYSLFKKNKKGVV